MKILELLRFRQFKLEINKWRRQSFASCFEGIRIQEPIHGRVVFLCLMLAGGGFVVFDPGIAFAQTFDRLEVGAKEKCHSIIQQSYEGARATTKPEHYSLQHLTSLDDWMENVLNREGGYHSIVRWGDEERATNRERFLKFYRGQEMQSTSGSYGDRQRENARSAMLIYQWRICIIDYVGSSRSRSSIVAAGVQGVAAESGSEGGAATLDVNQSIALAQQNQAQGDEQARKKGRREHRPDLDAKECLQFNPNTRLIRNACSYQIEVSYCAHNPKEANNNNSDVTWAFSCTEGKGRFGASTLRPGKDLGGMFPHRADGGVYVAACRGVYPKDIKFTGNQIDYRCRPI